MANLLHHPDECFLGKNDPKKPHVMFASFVDVDKFWATVNVPANIINSGTTAGGEPMAIALAMYLNDKEGDCTIAGKANTLRVNSNGAVVATDDECQTDYVRVTGAEGGAFDPQSGENDNGCVELDVLDDWVKNPMAGQELLGHAGIDMTNDQERRCALLLGGSIYPGWALSTDQQSQQIWGPGAAPAGSWGGHCAPIFDEWTEIPDGLVIGGVAIDKNLGTVFNVGTWSQYKACLGGPSGFLPFACDEGHILMLAAWLEKAKQLGIVDETALQAALTHYQHES